MVSQGRTYRRERKSALRGDVTVQRHWEAEGYTKTSIARAALENRIKGQFSLFADRVSTETIRANQMLALPVDDGIHSDERAAPAGTASDGTGTGAGIDDSLRLLRIGAQIRVTVRKVWVSMASSYPWQDLYQQVWTNLRC